MESAIQMVQNREPWPARMDICRPRGTNVPSDDTASKPVTKSHF